MKLLLCVLLALVVVAQGQPPIPLPVTPSPTPSPPTTNPPSPSPLPSPAPSPAPAPGAPAPPSPAPAAGPGLLPQGEGALAHGEGEAGLAGQAANAQRNAQLLFSHLTSPQNAQPLPNSVLSPNVRGAVWQVGLFSGQNLTKDLFYSLFTPNATGLVVSNATVVQYIPGTAQSAILVRLNLNQMASGGAGVVGAAAASGAQPAANATVSRGPGDNLPNANATPVAGAAPIPATTAAIPTNTVFHVLGFLGFDNNGAVNRYNLVVPELGNLVTFILASRHQNISDHNGMISGLCQQIQQKCTGANQQYASQSECVTSLGSKKFGDVYNLQGDTVLCRELYSAFMDSSFTQSNYCSALGSSGGGMCTAASPENFELGEAEAAPAPSAGAAAPPTPLPAGGAVPPSPLPAGAATPAGGAAPPAPPAGGATPPATPLSPPAGGAAPPAAPLSPPAGGAAPPAAPVSPPAGGAVPPAAPLSPPAPAAPLSPPAPAAPLSPPATPAAPLSPPAGGAAPPAGGLTPPSTPAGGATTPSTPAGAATPPSTPAGGAAPPSAPAFPPATPSPISPPASGGAAAAPPATPPPTA